MKAKGKPRLNHCAPCCNCCWPSPSTTDFTSHWQLTSRDYHCLYPHLTASNFTFGFAFTSLKLSQSSWLGGCWLLVTNTTGRVFVVAWVLHHILDGFGLWHPRLISQDCRSLCRRLTATNFSFGFASTSVKPTSSLSFLFLLGTVVQPSSKVWWAEQTSTVAVPFPLSGTVAL